MASVSPRVNKDGYITSWRVQARFNGKMMQQRFAAHDEEGAYEFAEMVEKREWPSAIRWLESKQKSPKTPTLEQFTALYLDPDSGMLTGIEPGTRHGYEAIARKSFNRFMGDLPIDSIDKQDVGRWVAWQEKQPSANRPGRTMAAKTVKNYHALLSNVFKAAIEAGYRTDNPARRTRLSSGVSREAVFLSREEFARLYDAIDPYYQPLLAFLVGTQCRWSEATALKWADVNTDTTPPTIRISHAWKKNPGGTPTLSVPKTRKGRRTISLWPELVALMGERGKPDQLVFKAKRTGGKIWYGSFNGHIWANAVRDSGIDRDPNIHDLRHTGASWLIADGMPLPYIQERLGHESITTTVHTYGHLMPDAHTRMADSLSHTLSGVLPARKEVEA